LYYYYLLSIIISKDTYNENFYNFFLLNTVKILVIINKSAINKYYLQTYLLILVIMKKSTYNNNYY
jgi:hypothetical protein